MKHKTPLSRHGTLKPSKTDTFQLTINGLLTKRAMLFNEARRARERLGEIRNDVSAIDRILATFDYEGDLDDIMPREKDGRMFNNGKLIRKCLDVVRESGPVTSRDIAVQIVEAMGDDPDDRKHLLRVTEGVSRTLRKQRDRGVVKSHKTEGSAFLWEMVRR